MQYRLLPEHHLPFKEDSASEKAVTRYYSRAENRLADRIQKELGESFAQALANYSRVLKEWAKLVTGQLGRRFETYAERYRAQAGRAMSKGVMGERVWLNRGTISVPEYHRTVPKILSAVAAIGMIFVFRGVLRFEPWPTLFGIMMGYLGKLWFVDRMVWLWNDMQEAAPEYRNWRIQKVE
jgi:hypothetical protein